MTAASLHTIDTRHGARDTHRRPRPAALVALAGLAALLAQSAFAQVATRLEKIEVNPQPTPLTRQASVSLRGNAGEILPLLVA